MISADLTVARLLDAHPALVDVLAGFHPHFRQLHNRLLRRVMGPRVTLAHAARIAGVPVDELLAAVRRAVGESEADGPPAAGPAPAHPAATSPAMPAELRGIPEARQVHVDVRDDIGRGEEPFARIMAAVRSLRPDEVLVLRAPFEPIPLYDVLGKRGFGHWVERLQTGDCSVWFHRAPATASPAPGQSPPDAGAAAPPRAAAPPLVLDVRGLEPPGPMVAVLERLDALAAGGELLVRHDRRPLFLYPQLDERGFAHDTREVAPGLVEIRIRRTPAPGAGP